MATNAQTFEFLLSQVRASGVALSGGKVYFYAAGTTTPKTVWLDRGKTTPAVNPYTLDANATAQLFGDGLYRIVIQDSTEVEKYDRDYIAIKDASGLAYDVGDYVSIAAACAALNGTGATLQYSTDQTLTANLTTDVELMPLNGAVVNHGVYTISYAGNTARWPDAQIFSGTGAVTLPGVSKVRWFTIADGATDDTNGVNTALGSSDIVDFGAYTYLYKGTKSFIGRSHLKIYGEHRQAKILVDSSSTILWDFSNTLAATRRGIEIDGLTFFPASDTSAVPSYIIKATYTPEFKITNCRFVNCSTTALIYFDNVYVFTIYGNIINPDEVNNNQGAAHPSSVGGSGIWINSEGHNGLIQFNRIRSSDSQPTSAGIVYGGGDSTQITNNAIESNRNMGIRFIGSSQAIVINNNYFEGASQPIDIMYEAAGTNYGHVIENNFFNALLPIKTVASNYNQTVRNNTFDGMTLVYNGFGTSNHYGLTIRDNLHRNPGTGDVFLFDTPTTISTLNRPDINISDKYEGTSGDEQRMKYRQSASNILQNATWAASSGTVSVTDSSSYYSGIRAYDISATVTGYHKVAIPGFDTAWRGRWITIYLWLKTSDGRNQTIRIAQDAGSTYVKDYTCLTSTTGNLIRIQHLIDANATALEIRPYIVSTNTALTAIFPTVKLGLHNELEFQDWR